MEDLQGGTLWITGLPGAGKTTLANILFEELRKRNLSVVKLDGDEIRKGLSCDISRHDGPGKYNSDVENLRRVIESWRQTVRERHKERGIPYFEVFLDVPLDYCVDREIERSRTNQTESLYLKAQSGLVNMIGFNGSQYEAYPEGVDLCIPKETMDQGPKIVAEKILENFIRFLTEKQRNKVG